MAKQMHLEKVTHFLVLAGADQLVTLIISAFPQAVLARDRGVKFKSNASMTSGLRRRDPFVTLLRRAVAVKRRSASILHALLTTLDDLLKEPGRLRNMAAFLETLQVEDICSAMVIFPDISLHALQPMLKLQSSGPLMSEGCIQRIIRASASWTVGSQEAFPPVFWMNYFGPGVSEAMATGWENSRRGYRVYLDANQSSPTSKAPTGGFPYDEKTRLEAETRQEHEHQGSLVDACFVGLLSATGPPYKTKTAGSYSFLQASVDLSQRLNTAAIFDSEVLIAILHFKWNAYARFYYTAELILYVCLLACFTASCFYIPTLSSDAGRWLWEIANILITMMFCTREYFQLSGQGFVRYCSDGWNWLDVSTYLLVYATIIARCIERTSNTASVLAAMALLPAWFKLLFYMR